MIDFNANYATVDITNIDRSVDPRFVPFPCFILRFIDVDMGLNLVLAPTANNGNAVMFEIDINKENSTHYHCGGMAVRNQRGGMYCSITYDRNKLLAYELSYENINHIINTALIRDHISMASPNPSTLMNRLYGVKPTGDSAIKVLVPPQSVDTINATLRNAAVSQANNFNPNASAAAKLIAADKAFVERTQEARVVNGKCPHHRRSYTDKNGRVVRATIVHPELFKGVTK